MKRLFSLLLILASFSVLSQEITVTNQIFTIVYSENLEQPLDVKYRVDCIDGTYSRSGMDFYRHKHVHTSDDKDYYKNVWDKGHMAPAAAFKCVEDELKATFTYLNCALQHEGLNRGPWKYLEAYERELAKKYGYVDVQIIVHFAKKPKRVPAGAAIPTGFTKIITGCNGGEEFRLEYYFKNTDLRGKNFMDFQIQ
jgi:DNA/RNA endonuclease G (NUC1)